MLDRRAILMVNEMTMTLALCAATGTSSLVIWLVITGVGGVQGKGREEQGEHASLDGIRTWWRGMRNDC